MKQNDLTSTTPDIPYRFAEGAFVKWTSDFHNNIKTYGIVYSRRVTRWGDIEYHCAPRFSNELTWLPEAWLSPDE